MATVDLPGFLGAFNTLATSADMNTWLNMGINLIISTIIGGIVLVAIIGILSKQWGESVKIGNAFLVVLIINVINIFGILGFLGFLGIISMILPVLIWIGLVKAFFGELSIVHAVIVGVVGYIISIFIIPILLSMVMGYVAF